MLDRTKPRIGGSATLAIMLLVVGQPAVGYPLDGWGWCDDAVIRYKFVERNGYRWTVSQMEAVEAGFKAWNKIRHPDGGHLVDVAHDYGSSSDPFEVYWVPKTAGYDGEAQCWGDTAIRFSARLRGAKVRPALTATAAHEMGHAVGLDHSGNKDSLPEGTNDHEEVPTMAACVANDTVAAAQQTLSADDQAAELQRRGGNQSHLHANSSFENGLRFWSFSNGAESLATYDDPARRAPSGGPNHVRIRRLAGGQTEGRGAVSQAVRVLHVGSFRGKAAVKKLDTYHAGTVVLKTGYRVLLYNEDVPSSCFPKTVLKRSRPSTWETRTFRPRMDWREFETDVTSGLCSWGPCGAEISVSLRNAMYTEASEVDTPYVAVDDLSANRA